MSPSFGDRVGTRPASPRSSRRHRYYHCHNIHTPAPPLLFVIPQRSGGICFCRRRCFAVASRYAKPSGLALHRPISVRGFSPWGMLSSAPPASVAPLDYCLPGAPHLDFEMWDCRPRNPNRKVCHPNPCGLKARAILAWGEAPRCAPTQTSKALKARA